MMTHTLARDSAKFLVAEIRSKLERIWAYPHGLDFNRIFLAAIRDRLNRSCKHFEADGGDDLHPDLYQPISEATVLLSCALSKSPIDRDGVRAAIELIDELNAVALTYSEGVNHADV
jgi:hypothetical protein